MLQVACLVKSVYYQNELPIDEKDVVEIVNYSAEGVL